MDELSDVPRTLEFEKPPVVEVVLGVQHDPLYRFQACHIGEFRSRVKNDFPGYEEHPPLEPVTEEFQVRSPQAKIEWSFMPPLPRVWFLSQDGKEVIQLQRDRILHNWRARSKVAYPSYPVCRSYFESSLKTYLDFLQETDCGPWVPNQCELTYVNHVLPGSAWQGHSRLEGVTRVWRDIEAFTPEKVSFSLTVVIPDSDGRPVGRVHATVQPKWKLPDRSPILEISLTARGRPATPTVEGVLEFLDLGHLWERKVFLGLMTEEILANWGRR